MNIVPSKARLWVTLAVIGILSFGGLGFIGVKIATEAPPIPGRVISTSGTTLFTSEDIFKGQSVWRTIGGMQFGSIWGHGSYLAPDWSADWLHREAVGMGNLLAQSRFSKAYDNLDLASRGAVDALVKDDIRSNTYDAERDVVLVSDFRARAIAQNAAHYESLFSDSPEMKSLRESYALQDNAIPDPTRRKALTAFFFWTAWAAGTERPGDSITYTSNWPHEPLIDNVITPTAVFWSIMSIVLLLAGIAGLLWYYLATREDEISHPPTKDPLESIEITPSMRATGKFFWTAMGLFIMQVILGAVTAHYAVEGQGFYGIEISDFLPYSVTRTWHTQLAVFWIATAWVGTGLYAAPLISGREPKFQALGVNLLWVALVVVVVGSLIGEWLGVLQQFSDLSANFWFGHQGYEYVDLGRFWQILLFVGLLFWLVLVLRALLPVLGTMSNTSSLVGLTVISTIAIGLFYGAGLMWGEHTHLSIAEYWRWWVVHLWVEGFFEVFATAIVALMLVKVGLVRASLANHAVLFATIVFLFGGILGTLHHLYFSGTPEYVMAFGAVFSALEVVPLALVGFEALSHYRLTTNQSWIARYRWPIMFAVAVSFWNLVGAGLFGFLINPPISLYFVQGLNTTAVHGHAALFGVYGMLGLALILFCARGLARKGTWSDRPLVWAFWSLNLGLAAMVLLSLLPYGLMQVWASLTKGYWYARSAEFLQQPIFDFFVWMRVPGDILFSVGVVAMAWFVLRIWVFPGHFANESGAGPANPRPAPGVGAARKAT